jgi:hypothetical protein
MKIAIPKSEAAITNPTNYFFITDLSGSMYGVQNELRETLKSIKNLIGPKDTFSLAYFSSYGDYNWICKGASASAGLDKLIEQNVYVRGLTCFTQVLDSLKITVADVNALTGSSNDVLFFLTDGYPNDRSPEREILNISKELRGLFSEKRIVGYSLYYNRQLLLEMAERMGGVFNHISDFKEVKKNASSIVANKKQVKIINLPSVYDLVWQVTSDDIIPLDSSTPKIEAIVSDKKSELYAVNLNELDSLPDDQLNSPNFVYSLAYMLSQKNKANLGVNILRMANDHNNAKMLRKAFTTLQKGQAENNLKNLAISATEISNIYVPNTMPLATFMKHINNNLGKISIDMANSKYRSISRKGSDVSMVKFVINEDHARIVGITGNENRANVSFLTARKGMITEIVDEDLRNRVEEYNKNSSTPIKFPIEATTYRNYTFIANGDFNFENFTLIDPVKPNEFINVNPNEVIDLVDENITNVNISEFSKLYKTLIEEKAHASVLRMYIKAHSPQKNLVDKRVERYDEDGAKLLEEMGLDYEMRYAPKTEGKLKDVNADFIPFVELTAQLKGAATISASASYKKYNENKKPNVGDAICWEHFKNYDKKLSDLGAETFVQFCQKTLEGVEDTVDFISQKISSLKFYLMTTNSWFVGVDKSDEFEYDGLVFKTKEVNEYL